jgi:hypothetical protein
LPEEAMGSPLVDVDTLGPTLMRNTTMNKFLGGMAIGAGIVIGAGLVIGVGGVGYQAASTYVAVRAANDPANIEASKEAEFIEIVKRVSGLRHDDAQRCMDTFQAEAGKTSSYVTDVSACTAGYGWDNVNATDASQQYKRVMSAKVREYSGGLDRVWLDKKIAEYFK